MTAHITTDVVTMAGLHSAASRTTAPTSPHLRGTIERLLTEAGAPGASVALVNAGGLLWADGVGLADLRSGAPARPDTVYHLFSGTKLFTAVAVLQLVEQGRVALDDPAARHVPEAAHLPGITLRHLLSHRSGLKETLAAFLAVTFPHEPAPTSAEALRRYRLVAARPAGTRVEYRNVNYALLGEVITRASGLQYRDYVTRHVLAPLGMRAGFASTDAVRGLAATGYIGLWDPMRLVLRALLPDVARRLYRGRVGSRMELAAYDLATAAAGGLVGSVIDFGRFLQLQLAGAAAEGASAAGGVLSSASIRLMQTMVAEGAAGIESRVGAGLGWKVGRVGDRLFLNHEGGGAGFTSELRLYPEAGIGVALAMNAMRMPATMRVAHRLCEAVFAHRAELLSR